MKRAIYLLIIALIMTGFVYQDLYIDPTGTYKLDIKTRKKKGEIYGYSGQILVKTLSRDKIVMNFEVNKGAPSYNSGSFEDTLDYLENKAIYRPGDEVDASCEILFNFTDKGVTVTEKADDKNSGCGFGHAVVADGFYKKISSGEPDFNQSQEE